MTTQYVIPYARFKAFTANGTPLVGGKLYTYDAGTSSNKTTYSDANGSANSINANPVILDANGEADIFGTGFYKLVLQDANGTQIWSKDNISLPGSSSSTILTPWQPTGLTPTGLTSSTFSVLGNQTMLFLPGTRLQMSNATTTFYGTVANASSANGSTTVVTVVNDTAIGIDANLSSVNYSTLMPASNVAGLVQSTNIPVSPVNVKTGNYVITAADLNQILEANSSNAIQWTLPAANAFPSGGSLGFKNSGNGTLTIIGTVEGTANATMVQGCSALIFSDGSVWRVASQTPAGASTYTSNTVAPPITIGSNDYSGPSVFLQVAKGDVIAYGASIVGNKGNVAGLVGIGTSISGANVSSIDPQMGGGLSTQQPANAFVQVSCVGMVAVTGNGGTLQIQMVANSAGSNITQGQATVSAVFLRRAGAFTPW